MLSGLEAVKDALLTVSQNVGHYTAWDDKPPYIVWAEDSETEALNTENFKSGQTIEGTIDLFTRDEDDALISNIPLALNKARIPWSLNSVQYEDETRLIHYEFLFHARQEYGDDIVQGT